MLFRLSLGLAISAPFLGAAPVPCITDTLANYAAPGFSCTAGTLLYDTFNFSVLSSSNPAIAITAAQITVTPGSLRLLFSSPSFQVTGADFETFQFGFRVDPPPFKDITGTLSVGGKTNGQGNTNINVGGVTGNQATFAFSLIANPASSVLTNAATFALTDKVVILNRIVLQANGGTAGFNSVEEVFGGPAFIPTPEPGAGILCAAGLIGLFTLRRRFSSLLT